MQTALSFDNIGVAVTDFVAALDFYGKLGFTPEGPADGAASLRNGDAALYVFTTSMRSADPARQLSMEGNASGIDHISFAVDDVDQVAADLQARGIRIESGPENQDWGRRTITVLDPDANRLWFLGPVHD